MDVFPRRNLPNEAEDWGRKVEGRVEGSEKSVQALEQTVGNINRGISGQLTSIGQQIQQIGTILTTLQTQQATLTAQQATLSQQQSDLAALVNQQVLPFRIHNEWSGNAFPTSDSEIIRVNVTVPSGYTRAAIIATGSLSITIPPVGGAAPLRGYMDINGTTTPRIVTSVGDANIQGSVSPSNSATITGLTGGSTFYVRIVGSYTLPVGANANNTAVLDGMVLFLK
jgi:hypothetical protein